MAFDRSKLSSCTLAATMVAAFSYATAQPSTGRQVTITQPVGPDRSSIAPTEPIVIHDPYSEAAHFVVRRLRFENQGPTVHVQPGTTVHASLEVNVHCTSCATPHNHLLVGFPGQSDAATCAFSGLRESNGWRTERFELIAPMRPGIYPLRIRIASTGETQCSDAVLAHWTRDMPGGPGPDSTIGIVVVENPRTEAPAATGPTTGTTSATVGITNGSFEQPDVVTGQAVPMASILGWVRTAGTGVEIHDGAVGRAAAGQQWVELDGVDSSAIAADVATNAGGAYLLTLSFAARPGTSALDNRLEVRWNGELVANLAASGEGMTTTSWTRLSLRVRGATGATTTRLELRDAGASNGQGTYVDDVSIAPTN